MKIVRLYVVELSSVDLFRPVNHVFRRTIMQALPAQRPHAPVGQDCLPGHRAGAGPGERASLYHCFHSPPKNIIKSYYSKLQVMLFEIIQIK